MEKLKTTSRQFPQREQSIMQGTFPSVKKKQNQQQREHGAFRAILNWGIRDILKLLQLTNIRLGLGSKLEQTFFSPWLSSPFFSFFHLCFSAFNLSGFSTSSSRQYDGIRVCVYHTHTHECQTRMVRKPLLDAILHLRIEAAQSRTRPRQRRDPPDRLWLEDDVGPWLFY